MKSQLIPGLSRTATYLTTLEMRAGQLTRDVFSTPAMIGLMERTCVELTEPYLDENEQTVGIHVDVRHLAATHIGQRVTVTAQLLEVKGNKLGYAVSATNDQNVPIGDGTHRRAVINTTDFAKGSESEQTKAGSIFILNPDSAVESKMPEARWNPGAAKASGCEVICALARCYEA
ncbi:MAG TPA: thioesterase family protein [Pyrinomonadaceae bacterium]|nr:thioesterase family protein [Pyrinomonadaceae bacterium]